jgi:hypothetical protein
MTKTSPFSTESRKLFFYWYWQGSRSYLFNVRRAIREINITLREHTIRYAIEDNTLYVGTLLDSDAYVAIDMEELNSMCKEDRDEWVFRTCAELTICGL